MPKKILHIFLVLLMVFGAVGVASANSSESNNPANAVFTKTESKYLASVGDIVTFTVMVENPNIDNGHNYFTDVAISDTVPAGLEVISVAGGSHVGNEVSADIGTLDPGQSKTITIKTKAKTPGKYTNTANLVYTVDQGQKKMCCGKEEHTDLGERLSDKTLRYNEHDFNANDHKGEIIGSYKSVEMNDQNNNYNNQGHQNDQNCNNKKVHQNDQNCNNNNHRWVHCDKFTHKHSDKCCKWVSYPVQRTAQATSDPLFIEAATPQTPSSMIKEPAVKAQKETVGMQETGAPIVALLLAGLILFSGMLMPKLK